MKQMIIKIDDDATIESMSIEMQLAINNAGIQYPEKQMIGTKSYYGKRLILIMTPLTKVDIEDLIEMFDLNWTVVACEGELIDQSGLLNYFEDVPVFDENGDHTDDTPITDLTGKLQTFAGHEWTWY